MFAMFALTAVAYVKHIFEGVSCTATATQPSQILLSRYIIVMTECNWVQLSVKEESTLVQAKKYC